MEFTTMTSAACVENLDAVTGFVRGCAERFALDEKRKIGLLIAMEEAFVNVCHHAYPGGGGDVELSCGGDGAAFVVEIADKGIAFDILSLPSPDTTVGLMDREVGGLGVLFIRKLTDDLSYRRENGRNILRMVLNVNKGELS